MKRSINRRTSFALAVIVLIAGSFFAGRQLTGREGAQVHAEDTFVTTQRPEAYFTCIPEQVAVFSNRMHVRCSNSPGSGIYFFAYPIKESPGYMANRWIAVSQSALALNKTLVVHYNSDSNYNPAGCWTKDCRLLTGLVLLK